MVVNAALITIVIMLWYSSAGFTNLEITPGGGFPAGVGACIAIFGPTASYTGPRLPIQVAGDDKARNK